MLALVLADRGCSALVVCGHDGLDEISTAAPTRVWVVTGNAVTPTTIDAAEFGQPRSVPGDLRGGGVSHNAVVARRIVEGDTGPGRDAVLINAAAAIAAYRGLDGDVRARMAAGLRGGSGHRLRRRQEDGGPVGSGRRSAERPPISVR
ncbi:hypothetical protein GCM10023088_49040 [Actinomadura verrucosospora]